MKQYLIRSQTPILYLVRFLLRRPSLEFSQRTPNSRRVSLLRFIERRTNFEQNALSLQLSVFVRVSSIEPQNFSLKFVMKIHGNYNPDVFNLLDLFVQALSMSDTISVSDEFFSFHSQKRWFILIHVPRIILSFKVII